VKALEAQLSYPFGEALPNRARASRSRPACAGSACSCTAGLSRAAARSRPHGTDLAPRPRQRRDRRVSAAPPL